MISHVKVLKGTDHWTHKCVSIPHVTTHSVPSCLEADYNLRLAINLAKVVVNLKAR